ncbi:MAG: DNA repair protein RecO [Candidatus Yonathbacteria bacterium CG10_big_fil_rev_8_21_14_0_10_43_136]|uniref:DNA repair protein RecO n=1 Tax=Candidatus Yonathbacteria bacterium CG_4_10_14_0_8_um_filter_43_17 TaxID=1975099 RepID=A0A2M7Q4P3_9BACT|nr:MAG: DNA repair protein RecO [Candidatus Yonathbacteria bacterium CG10_big_fil_rev_8_21_14_0_10_43_136]PIX56928.1 MAG: DNA repair protein RecO [Candidatus Yonathbacteria bacterium CG_4_10_14_3_um_filter_43_12]PIY58401.1 MAG: DNA repair protein RecO [Candidatus Yonathbacteria bacterium CG_4_10_14_0_8_um_filter_43_17]PJC22188.1 MAG: DNA repair protein RecO [Candidatus Yonathbacteria bacterium CG_4_9_14_0_2_um_filter_43_16]
MSHHIYHTCGIILASNAVGESNRFYKIFTEELGLIGGSAQSVREGKSKLRYTLQDYSIVNVDLVRGKEVWRIVSAGEHRSLDTIKNDQTRLKHFASYCALLSRFLHGEGRDQELFDEIISVIDFLEKETIPEELTLSFESLATFRVLARLGYVDPEGYRNFFVRDAYSAGILKDFEKIRPKVLHKINEALIYSHL